MGDEVISLEELIDVFRKCILYEENEGAASPHDEDLADTSSLVRYLRWSYDIPTLAENISECQKDDTDGTISWKQLRTISEPFIIKPSKPSSSQNTTNIPSSNSPNKPPKLSNPSSNKLTSNLSDDTTSEVDDINNNHHTNTDTNKSISFEQVSTPQKPLKPRRDSENVIINSMEQSDVKPTNNTMKTPINTPNKLTVDTSHITNPPIINNSTQSDIKDTNADNHNNNNNTTAVTTPTKKGFFQSVRAAFSLSRGNSRANSPSTSKNTTPVSTPKKADMSPTVRTPTKENTIDIKDDIKSSSGEKVKGWKILSSSSTSFSRRNSRDNTPNSSTHGPNSPLPTTTTTNTTPSNENRNRNSYNDDSILLPKSDTTWIERSLSDGQILSKPPRPDRRRSSTMSSTQSLDGVATPLKPLHNDVRASLEDDNISPASSTTNTTTTNTTTMKNQPSDNNNNLVSNANNNNPTTTTTTTNDNTTTTTAEEDDDDELSPKTTMINKNHLSLDLDSPEMICITRAQSEPNVNTGIRPIHEIKNTPRRSFASFMTKTPTKSSTRTPAKTPILKQYSDEERLEWKDGTGIAMKIRDIVFKILNEQPQDSSNIETNETADEFLGDPLHLRRTTRSNSVRAAFRMSTTPKPDKTISTTERSQTTDIEGYIDSKLSRPSQISYTKTPTRQSILLTNNRSSSSIRTSRRKLNIGMGEEDAIQRLKDMLHKAQDREIDNELTSFNPYGDLIGLPATELIQGNTDMSSNIGLNNTTLTTVTNTTTINTTTSNSSSKPNTSVWTYEAPKPGTWDYYYNRRYPLCLSKDKIESRRRELFYELPHILPLRSIPFIHSHPVAKISPLIEHCHMLEHTSHTDLSNESFFHLPSTGISPTTVPLSQQTLPQRLHIIDTKKRLEYMKRYAPYGGLVLGNNTTTKSSISDLSDYELCSGLAYSGIVDRKTSRGYFTARYMVLYGGFKNDISNNSSSASGGGTSGVNNNPSKENIIPTNTNMDISNKENIYHITYSTTTIPLEPCLYIYVQGIDSKWGTIPKLIKSCISASDIIDVSIINPKSTSRYEFLMTIKKYLNQSEDNPPSSTDGSSPAPISTRSSFSFLTSSSASKPWNEPIHITLSAPTAIERLSWIQWIQVAKQKSIDIQNQPPSSSTTTTENNATFSTTTTTNNNNDTGKVSSTNTGMNVAVSGTAVATGTTVNNTATTNTTTTTSNSVTATNNNTQTNNHTDSSTVEPQSPKRQTIRNEPPEKTYLIRKTDTVTT